jgi:hypothetical protein
MITRRLPYTVFNRCITLLYGTVDEANAYFRRHCPDGFRPLHPSCQGHWKSYQHSGGHEADFIFVRKQPGIAAKIEYLAHEALHCASHALRMAGVPHTEETEETYTYYQAWLIRECLPVVLAR